MNAKPQATLMLLVTALMAGCGTSRLLLTPTPPLGWQSPVSGLLIDESAFPEGWEVGSVKGTTSDPTVNHVTREWGRKEIPGTAFQSIWRAYTVADAERKYNELRASQFKPNRPLNPDTLYVAFEPPVEVNYQSQVADEFYLACGWWGVAYCEVVARYGNYVVELRLEREAEYEEHISYGLTYAEIETVVRVMDAKFAEAMESFTESPP
jgi:hypothetical protein